MTIQQLLDITISRNASDLHLSVGFPPLIRVNGELMAIPGTEVITVAAIEDLINPLLSSSQKEQFLRDLELDFSVEFAGKGRFRCNLYKQKDYSTLALRLIPKNIKSLTELGFPQVVGKLVGLRQGFILITGPTGHGKSTAIAAFINQINQDRASHIITIEDPIEYIYPPGKSLISQRELFKDTKSWPNALRAALREDPDVVLVGEMRDLETMASAITIAETGHLVFSTLHTNSASQSVDRIIDAFPQDQQSQIRLQLAETLEAVLSLRLVPTINPGRTLAVEILLATPATRNLIREGKTFMIDNLIMTSAEIGMITLESSLANMVKSGLITHETATAFALRPELLAKLIR